MGGLCFKPTTRASPLIATPVNDLRSLRALTTAQTRAYEEAASVQRDKLSDAAYVQPEEEIRVYHDPRWLLWGGRGIDSLLQHTSLMDLEYVVRLIELGGVLPRWQDVPEIARIGPHNVWRLKLCTGLRNGRDGLTSAAVLVLSYPWLDWWHPDKAGSQLRGLLPVFRAVLTEAHLADPRSTVGLMVDFACLPQKPFGTEGERTRFKQGLATINEWYFHPATAVLLVTSPPPVGEQYSNTRLHGERGWCFFEFQAAVTVKRNDCLWDMRHFDADKCSTYRGLVEHMLVSSRPPPMSPEQFKSELESRVDSGALAFTAKADVAVVVEQFRVGFQRAFAEFNEYGYSTVHYEHLGWGADEGRQMLAALRYIKQCGCRGALDIRCVGNPFVTEPGMLEAIAQLDELDDMEDEDEEKPIFELSIIVSDDERAGLQTEDLRAEQRAVVAEPEPPSSLTLAVIQRLEAPPGGQRAVSGLSWRPESRGRTLAVGYAAGTPHALVWDLTKDDAPAQELSASAPVTALEYHPSGQSLIFGGSADGCVSLWDVRQGAAAVAASSANGSHRSSVSSVKWLEWSESADERPMPTGECISTSEDGQLCFWDLRKLDQPSETTLLIDTSSTAKTASGPQGDWPLLGGMSITLSGGAKALVGTAQGKVLSTSRKGKSHLDKVRAQYIAHCGAVRGLQRHPLLHKYFLSLGDCTVQLWNEELYKRPLITCTLGGSLLDGAWSQTRAGVLFAAQSNGLLNVWDLVRNRSSPTNFVQVHDQGLCTLGMHQQGALLAAGSVDGSVFVLELCEQLVQPQPSEELLVQQTLESRSKGWKSAEACDKMRKVRARA